MSADFIVEVLERRGFERSAAMVRDLSRRDTERNRMEEHWRLLYVETLKRLHQYEPPAEREQARNYQPPPEASD